MCILSKPDFIENYVLNYLMEIHVVCKCYKAVYGVRSLVSPRGMEPFLQSAVSCSLNMYSMFFPVGDIHVRYGITYLEW